MGAYRTDSHKEQAKNTLDKVKQGVETMTNAACETVQATSGNVLTATDRENLEKLRAVLEKRIELIERPAPLD